MGEVRSFTLPTSGLQVQYSTKYFKNVDEEMNTLVPDVKISMTFDDFRQGIDPVYECIKAITIIVRMTNFNQFTVNPLLEGRV